MTPRLPIVEDELLRPEGKVVLAEVSDKIPSVAFFWCFHVAAAVVMVVLTLLSQRRAVLVLLLPLAIAWAVFFAHDALAADDPLRDAVVAEMGAGYNVQQAVAALTPLIGVVAVVRRRRRVRHGT